MTQSKWKRGDLVRATSRLMFGAYEGNEILPDGEQLCYPLWADDLSEENEW